jgi:hypothetical protein
MSTRPLQASQLVDSVDCRKNRSFSIPQFTGARAVGAAPPPPWPPARGPHRHDPLAQRLERGGAQAPRRRGRRRRRRAGRGPATQPQVPRRGRAGALPVFGGADRGAAAGGPPDRGGQHRGERDPRGLAWELVAPGARLALGAEAVVEVASYTQPCRTIAASFLARRTGRVSQRTHPGWSRVYARVIEAGTLRVGTASGCSGRRRRSHRAPGACRGVESVHPARAARRTGERAAAAAAAAVRGHFHLHHAGV